MGRGPKPEPQPPEAGTAIAFLRKRAGLTQGQLAERVSAGGGSLSAVYLSQIERGARTPSAPMLQTILDQVGSDEAELGQVATSISVERSRTGDPTQAYLRHARTPGAPAPLADDLSTAFTAAPVGPDVWRRLAAPDPVEAVGAAPELTELGALYAGLPRADQLTVLGFVRQIAARRR